MVHGTRFALRWALVLGVPWALLGCGADDSQLFVSEPRAADGRDSAASMAPDVPEGRPASAAAPPMEAAGGTIKRPGGPLPAEQIPESAPLIPPEDAEPADVPVPDDGAQTWVFVPSVVHTY
jgi:hypothetical protein